jgi:hypothetical protein
VWPRVPLGHVEVVVGFDSAPSGSDRNSNPSIRLIALRKSLTLPARPFREARSGLSNRAIGLR